MTKKHECIECEHWRTINTGTPTKAIIGDLIPERFHEEVTISECSPYCKLGHTKRDQACKDFKETPDFIR